MPRYFIDTDDGDTHVHDDVGYNLNDDEAAAEMAQTLLPDMARDKLPDGDRRDFNVTVRTETDRVIYTVKLCLIGAWPGRER